MQSNTITLNVDALNDGNTAAEVYERSEYFQNRSEYIGASHVSGARDQINFYRTRPTKNGNFKGVDKSAFKLTYDHVVDGVDASTSLTSPIIVEVSFSVPVGCTEAEVTKCRQRALALLDDDTVMDKLNSQLMV